MDCAANFPAQIDGDFNIENVGNIEKNAPFIREEGCNEQFRDRVFCADSSDASFERFSTFDLDDIHTEFLARLCINSQQTSSSGNREPIHHYEPLRWAEDSLFHFAAQSLK